MSWRRQPWPCSESGRRAQLTRSCGGLVGFPWCGKSHRRREQRRASTGPGEDDPMSVEPRPPTLDPEAFVVDVLEERIPLGRALGIVCRHATRAGNVALALPIGAGSENHVGTMYAGAGYVLAELAA
jgi:hypothetical protein